MKFTIWFSLITLATSINLNNTEVVNTRFGNNLGISESLKRDLIVRGAIFEDAPGDRAKILTSA